MSSFWDYCGVGTKPSDDEQEHLFAVVDETGQWNVVYFGSLAEATLQAVADWPGATIIHKQSETRKGA